MPNTPSPLGYSGSPLASDEPALNRAPSPLDYSGSPLNLGLSRGPTAPMGLQPPQMGSFDLNSTMQQVRDMFNAPMPGTGRANTEAQIFFSPSTGEMVVNGFRFNQRNATQALASEQWAAQPRQRFTLPDDATDWREMSRSEYNSYLDTIRNPSFGRRVAEGWETGWRGFGDIALGAGRAVDQVFTGTDNNQWMITAQANLRREYEENAPFLLGLRDVHDVGSGLTYLAQLAMQGAPWFVETIASMAAGALIGGAVSGGVGAPAGAVEGFLAKEALRQASRGAIETFMRNNIRRGAAAYMEAQAEHGVAQVTREQVLATAARTGAANADEVNRFFNFGERAYHMTRSDAAGASLGGGSGFSQAGSLIVMGASNYFTGVGDIRNSIAEAGGDPNTAESVANIWAYALPYAAIESMGDLLVTQPIAHLVPGIETGGGSFVGNVARNFGLVAAGEGVEEGAQYITTQQAVSQATNRPIDIDPIDLLENVIGGAAAGGPLGAFTGAFSPNNGRVLPDFSRPTPTASTPTGPTTPVGPTGLSPIGGLDINADPNDTDPNYVGYAEQQAMRNNALSDPGSQPYTYDGEGSMGGLDLNQDPNETDPNYVGYAEQQAMRNNAIMDIGPTTVTPPQVAPAAPVRDINEIYRDIRDGRRVAPQEYQRLRNHVRELQMQDPTNPVFTSIINTINDVETEANTVEPPFNWDAATRQNLDTGENLQGNNPIAFDGLPTYGKHRMKTPEGRALLESMQNELRGRTQEATQTAANTEELGVIRDHMGRTKGISASMENAAGVQARADYANRTKLTPSQKKNKKRKIAEAEERRAVREQRQKRHAQELRISEAEVTTGEGQDNRQASEIFADAKTKGIKGEALKRKASEKKAKIKASTYAAERGELTSEERVELRKLDEFIFALYRPNQVPDEVLDRYNELAKRAPKGLILAGKPMTRAELEQDQARIDEDTRREETDTLDNDGPEEYMRQAGDKPSKTELDKQYKKDLNALNAMREQNIPRNEPNREAVRNAAARAAEAARAEPKVETKPQPKVKPAAESNDLKEAASIKRSNKTETHPIEPTSEVDQKRIDKAYTQGLKERETINSLLRSIKALEDAAMRHQKKNPEFTNDTPYSRTRLKWPIVDGTALSLNELRALLIVVNKEDGKVNDPERRAIAFNETIKSIWMDIVKEIGPAARMKGTKDFDAAVERFVPFVKRQVEEVSNWLNAKISDTLPPVRAAAQQALAELATQEQKPQRGFSNRKRMKLRTLNIPRRIFPKSQRATDAVITLNKLVDKINQRPNNFGRTTVWQARQAIIAIRPEVSEDSLAGQEVHRQLKELDRELAALYDTIPGQEPSSERVYPGRPQDGGIATKIILEELEKNPNLTFTSIHPATRRASEAIRSRINELQRIAGEIQSSAEQLSNLVAQIKRRGRDKPQAATNEDNVLYKKVSVPVARAAVNKIQRMISENARFKSVSVVGNVSDLFDQLGDIVMTAPNGAKHTLLQYVMREAQIMKNENPSLKDISLESVAAYYIQTHMTASGVVVPGYQHLIIMADYIKDEKRLYRILEHEYIVHSGLKALIPDPVERALFLHRFSLIPGVHEMREYLVAQLPMYENVSYLDQLEEVLAYHSMHGPLAVEQLLKAEEGINQETRQTLWDELVDIVKQWIKNTFGDKEADTRTLVMDDIIGALRQYAITGYMGDLEGVLDKYNAPNVDQDLKSAFIQRYESQIKRGFAEAEPINEALFGTNEDNDPMRPYRKQSYPDYIKGVLKSSIEVTEKLRSVRDGGFATPVKEQLKKISRELETMNNMKLRSTLIEQVLEVMHNTIRVARRIMTESMIARPYAELSAHTAWLRRRFGDKRPGSTKAQRDAYSSLALAATNSKLAKLTDEIVRASPRILVRHPDGTYTINWDVFAQYDADGKLTGGLLKEGMFTRQEFLEGIPQFTVDSEGVVTQHGVAKFTEQQLNDGYEIYVAETKELGKSMMKIMEHTAIMLSRKNDVAIDKIMRDNRFKPEDEAFANEVLERMFKLYADIAFHDYTNISRKKRAAQAGRARQVLIELQRAFHSAEKVKDWTDLSRKREDVKKNPRGNANDAFKWREQVDIHEDVKPFANQIRWFLEYDDTFGDSRFARINNLGVSPNQQYAMLGAFQALLNAETEAHERENKAIQSILGNYVEMTRKGRWRVAVIARDAEGKEFDIPPDLYAVLPVTYTESKREADDLQEKLNRKFAGEHYFLDDDGNQVPITFEVGVRQAPGTQTMSDVPSIGEFLKVSEAVGLSLDAKQMKEIANMIESASIRKRYGLQRSATPGVDFDVLFNNNATLTGRAWQAAKISQSWMLDSIMSDPKNKQGDWNLLARLQREFDIANRGAPDGVVPPASFVRNKKAVAIAERDLLRYANQLRHMAEHTTNRPTVNIRTTKGELKLKIENESEAFLQHAQALQKSLEKNELEVNLNDLISKTGALRQQAVVMQLGTIASGMMNAFTPLTHLPWVLTARHEKTGYGEGFDFSEVVSEIISAVHHIGDVFKNYNSAEQLLELLEEAKKGNNRTSLTIEELQFMYDETLDGILTPQQTYSMTGGTESNIRDLFWRNVSKVALIPFANVESSTRRIAALATYRLATRRYMQAGLATSDNFKDRLSDQYKKVRKDIEYIIDFTQGDYTNINRPRGFRGDLAQYVLQYKMFPLISVLMINNLPLAQKVAVLGVIGLLAGLKGEPFADDFADIYDTLMQNLGFKHDSVELGLTNFFEDIMPGSSNWIMHGGIDALAFGGTMSSRLSMGDNIPLTGIFRPKADVGRELLNAFGPAFAANADSVEWAGTVADFMIQQLGMKPRTTSWVELFRKIPQGQLRALADATSMAATGQIIDPNGRLTSDEVNALSVFSRALGFYPLESSRANTAVRLDRMHTGYMRAVRTRFILAYANAYRAGDQDAMDRINAEVENWNDAVEMTGQEDMEIRNFRQAARRAGREAASTVIERTSRGAPDYSRIDRIAEITLADTETDDE